MKKLLVFTTVVVLLASCGKGDRGMLVGAKGKKWNPEKPYGMTLVPGGAFIMGKADEDIANKNDAPPKTVTVPSYYMDETEITNSEYRQFVYWVRDSIFRTNLAIAADLNGAQPGDGGIGEFAFVDADESEELTPWQEYYKNNYEGLGETGYEGRKLNNDVELIWDTEDIPDEFYAEAYDSMYIPFEEAYNGQRTINTEKIVFTYTEMDMEAAARNKGSKRSDYITQKKIPVYPDTTVWIRDFNYSYNEPMHNDYFYHEAYSDYPVVGVTWTQAKAFCQWRTLYHNAYRKKKNVERVNGYRLPTEAEWEYAARGGLASATYPWGGPYAKNDRGCFLANFKPLRGDYAADQALYTVEAKSYEPNEYNLYNMSGNVAEWVDSSYDVGSYEYMSSMSPVVNDKNNKRKGVRGGSWKDVSYFLQVGTRDFEYQDSARSYIGFRTVQSYLGTDVTLNASTN
ncbi:MAG: gliding motility lipoprotein GldK [Nonlabens sp.]